MKLRTLYLALSVVVAAACGDDPKQNEDAAVPADAGVDGPPDASCFTNPQTHIEIINACSTAQKIYKDSHPPLQNPDGSLPPLP
jgi:hypothetical protein